MCRHLVSKPVHPSAGAWLTPRLGDGLRAAGHMRIPDSRSWTPPVHGSFVRSRAVLAPAGLGDSRPAGLPSSPRLSLVPQVKGGRGWGEAGRLDLTPQGSRDPGDTLGGGRGAAGHGPAPGASLAPGPPAWVLLKLCPFKTLKPGAWCWWDRVPAPGRLLRTYYVLGAGDSAASQSRTVPAS